MVTLQKYGRSYNRNVLEIAGLSTDVKPTDKLENAYVVNGSVFIEIDTGKSYIFDETNKIWNQNVSSGGDGVDGKSAYEIAVDNGFEGTEIEWLASLKGEKAILVPMENQHMKWQHLMDLSGQNQNGYYLLRVNPERRVQMARMAQTV